MKNAPVKAAGEVNVSDPLPSVDPVAESAYVPVTVSAGVLAEGELSSWVPVTADTPSKVRKPNKSGSALTAAADVPCTRVPWMLAGVNAVRVCGSKCPTIGPPLNMLTQNA